MKALTKNLIRKLASGLLRLGFHGTPGGGTFQKPFPGGLLGIRLGTIRHSSDVDVTVSLSVRYNDVEDLVNAENSLISEKEKMETSSLGIELGNLIEGRQKRWTIRSEGDVPTVADQILADVEQYALPYFATYSDMRNAFIMLSAPDSSAWSQSPLHAVRAKHVIAMAWILGLRMELPGLIARQMEYLQAVGDPGLPSFTTFVAQLTRRP